MKLLLKENTLTVTREATDKKFVKESTFWYELAKSLTNELGVRFIRRNYMEGLNSAPFSLRSQAKSPMYVVDSNYQVHLSNEKFNSGEIVLTVMYDEDL